MSTILTPTVGVVYKFIFQNGYHAQNGIYRLAKLSEYDEYLTESGDLLRDFYEPNGKTDTELNADLPKIRASKIMKLVNPETIVGEETDAVFAPLCFLLATPDYNVKRYPNIAVVSNIGIAEDTKDYDFVCERITEAVESTLGISPNPKIVILKYQWMTEQEYADIVANRDHSKRKYENYYAATIRLEKEVQSLNTIINEYEKLIINQQEQIEELKASSGQE